MSDVPKAVARAEALATEHGWSTWVTATETPISSVALRIRRGDMRAFGWWLTESGCRWKGGATFGLRHFPTLRSFLAFIESEAR
jgi:hypothetical protein